MATRVYASRGTRVTMAALTRTDPRSSIHGSPRSSLRRRVVSESPIRVLIVDDEPLARRRIRSLLEDDPEFTLVGECGNGLDAVEAIRGQSPDVVFLDIQMPELDGFGVVREVGVDELPVVVFVTAHDEHALQ